MNTPAHAEKLFIKKQKGCSPEEVSSLSLTKEKGIEGDIHSDGDRQVCLVFADTEKAIEEHRNDAPCLSKFSCNLVVSGEKYASLKTGAKIKAGSCTLEVTYAGRECHGLCELEDCPLIDGIFFAAVSEDGMIAGGDEIFFEG